VNLGVFISLASSFQIPTRTRKPLTCSSNIWSLDRRQTPPAAESFSISWTNESPNRIGNSRSFGGLMPLR